jgi:hypothetical protein
MILFHLTTHDTTREAIMGYYVTLTNADFSIPETPEVLAALHEMETKFHEIKRGGSFGPGGQEAKWFSWMPDVRTLDSVAAVFERLGFTIISHDGRVSLVGYDDKTGQEDLFIAVVAPFVDEDAYMEWRGEEGEVWRYEVKDHRLVTIPGEMKWGEPEPYMEIVYDFAGSPTSNDYKPFVIQVDPYASNEEIVRAVEQARADAAIGSK